jgi:hypothetical protein
MSIIKGKALRGLLNQRGYTAKLKDGYLTIDNTNFGISYDCPDGSMEILANYNRDGAWNGLRNAIAYRGIIEIAEAVIKKIEWSRSKKNKLKTYL